MVEMSFIINGIKRYDRIKYVGQDLTKAIQNCYPLATNIEFVRVIKHSEN